MTVVALPADSDLPEETVVDVTDDAVAGTDQDAVANAVAQLPTQSTGEDDVIDLSAVEDGAGTDGAGQDATEADEPADETATQPVADAAPDADGAAAAAAPGVAAGLVSAAAGADDDTVEDDSAEDDLERIEGIGPRIASALRSAGIRSFRRLADADVPTLQAALEAAGLRFAPSLPTWSRQARFLADGDEVGFIKLTESLVAGREPGRSR
ncbi:helix-hairpin-helix domain-containing protein [Kineosporia sp. A_224]|uniref:helix-hairpin-helix domain-containing protein n=1 Tax=Kineosporia sp. A_224 TaxID=1962180 RepID=UPI000B4ADA52